MLSGILHLVVFGTSRVIPNCILGARNQTKVICTQNMCPTHHIMSWPLKIILLSHNIKGLGIASSVFKHLPYRHEVESSSPSSAHMLSRIQVALPFGIPCAPQLSVCEHQAKHAILHL